MIDLRAIYHYSIVVVTALLLAWYPKTTCGVNTGTIDNIFRVRPLYYTRYRPSVLLNMTVTNPFMKGN